MSKTHTALDKQEGGKHYKDMVIQPIEFIHANNLGFCEANVVKYITRAGKKPSEETTKDLKKAIDYINFEIERITNGR